ncbi:MAG: diguanylate cyclase [Thiotrichales bacterium]|nr:diguanylate cyclase [Thiotrichales bacterium]
MSLKKPVSIIIGFVLSLMLLSLNVANANDPTPPNIQKIESNSLEKVTLQLKWLHQFQFAGYYAAQLKGFYKEEGLDVTIKPRDPYQNNIKQVIEGQAEYGVSDSVLLLYQARNEPVVLISAIFQHSPQAIVTLKSSGLDSPYKLDKKSIAFYKEDTDGFPLLAMFEQLGVQPKIDRMLIKGGPETLIRGETQAYPCYLSNEPYLLKQAGQEINIIKPMNFGIDFYGDILFTNRNEATQHPERVERFKRATIKGWHYALEHKKELAEHIKYTLGADKTIDHLLYEADVIEEMMGVKSVPIGTIDSGRLQFMHNLFEKHGLIQKKLNLEDGIFKPIKNNLNYSEQELAWIKQNPTVNVAIDINWPPIEFVNEQREFSGIASGYLNYLSNKTGIKFIPATDLNWSQAVENVKSGQLDMYSAVTNTPERSEYVRFTEPYLRFPMVIATQKGEMFIGDMKRLNNQVVAVVEDYESHENMKNQYPNVPLLTVKTPKEGIEAVATGKAYAYIDNIAVISYLIQSNHFSNIQISGETPFRADISMAVRKDWPELKSIIQKTLNGMDEITKNQLTDRWLQVTYKKEFEWQTLLYILLPIGIALLAFIIYGRRLKALNADLIETQNRLHISNKTLQKLSVTDHLTKAYNRNYLDTVMEQEMHRTNRYNNALSLIIIDLDDFKKVNDTFGHIVGDEVLIKTVYWVQSAIRETDTFGRWGGEEFVLICPNTNLQEAIHIAEKIRAGISELTFSTNHKQTVSIGVARYHKKETAEQWTSYADSALYKAKKQGKNQVAYYSKNIEILDDSEIPFEDNLFTHTQPK